MVDHTHRKGGHGVKTKGERVMMLPMLLEVPSQLRLVVGKITQQGIAASGVAEHALAHDRLIPK
jgi:hypothetical protein